MADVLELGPAQDSPQPMLWPLQAFALALLDDGLGASGPDVPPPACVIHGIETYPDRD